MRLAAEIRAFVVPNPMGEMGLVCRVHNLTDSYIGGNDASDIAVGIRRSRCSVWHKRALQALMRHLR